MSRKVIYTMQTSLDGFIEGPGGELDWHSFDEEMRQHVSERERAFDVHLYGRGLYEKMSAYWPTADQDLSAAPFNIEYAPIWRALQKVVFSTTLERVEWNSRLVRGNIAEEVARLKQEPGKDLALGGPGLATSFMKLDLIDEYRVYVGPLVLGAGKRMFGALDERLPLRLVETRRFGSGVVLLQYERADGRRE